MAQTDLRIDGARCAGCMRAIAEALGSLPGVSKTEIGESPARIRVEHDERTAARATLITAIEQEGYAAVPL
ncbi:MAG TPA: heavy-metal-associated domain-containing protein [Thermoanaerobaculia bacterium]|nr:heavy-metal-associated domain-containing protein [Thermoanaerobaculia bacterium]